MIASLYNSVADLKAMTQLLADLGGRGQRVYPNATDLFEELADPEVQITAQLWEKAGHLIGFAYISPYQNLVDVFKDGEFTPSLEKEMMEWIYQAAGNRNRVRGEKLTLDASSLEVDSERAAFLERHGFTKLEESSILMGRPLDRPILEPRLLPGFCIRPMGGMAELEAYVRLHRASFGTENMTIAYRQSIMNASGYIPELDLVAEAPNGELAAFCVCQIFPGDSPRAGGQKEGWTDPVGTHPDYRGMGLAKALMLTGMGLLKERGIDTAVLGTSSTNTAMQRLAEGLGFRKVSNMLWYSKTIELCVIDGKCFNNYYEFLQ